MPDLVARPNPDLAPPSIRSSRPDAYQVGDLIGRKYHLLEMLGEGGMAEVWKAHNAELDVEVAIKFVRRDLDYPTLDERLLQEARAAARLGHPAIVRVLDFGKTRPGDPYIVMELLEGEHLGLLLERRGRLAATRAVQMLLPIAHALATAHDKGIVHRDIKPENIFLVRNENLIQPKLVDFGVAKLERVNARITKLGAAMGSPGYMSPEQARGIDVDHRTDIWAFSVLLYEAVTGRLPFDGKTYNALIRSIIEDVPPPIDTFAAGDDELWAILERGLAKSLAERWATMRDLGRALAEWLIAQGIAEDVAGASLSAAWLTGPATGERARVDSTGLPEASSPTPAPDALPDSAPDVQAALETLRPPKEERVRKRRWPLVAGAVVIGVCGAALVLYALGRRQAPSREVEGTDEPTTLRDPAATHGEPSRPLSRSSPAAVEAVQPAAAPPATTSGEAAGASPTTIAAPSATPTPKPKRPAGSVRPGPGAAKTTTEPFELKKKL